MHPPAQDVHRPAVGVEGGQCLQGVRADGRHMLSVGGTGGVQPYWNGTLTGERIHPT